MATTDIIYAPQVTEEDQSLAKSTLEAILRSGDFRLEADGKTFVLPASAAKQIVSVLNLTAEGQRSDVVSASPEWTIHEAAVFLGTSEECVNELLNHGVIEYRQDAERRLVMRHSLLAYDQRLKKGQTAMNEVVRLSEEIGLYDD